MFEKVLDKVDSWIGHSFIISSLVPAFIFVFCNFFLLRELFPRVDNSLESLLTNTLTGYISLVSFIIIACAIFAYVTDPLVVYMTRALDGYYFPKWMKRELLYEKTQEFDSMVEDRITIADQVLKFKQIERRFYVKAKNKDGEDVYAGELVEAYKAGLKLEEIRDRGLVKTANRKLARLWTERQQGDLLSPDALSDALKSLVLAVENNCPDPQRLAFDRLRHRPITARGYLEGEWNRAASTLLQQDVARARTLIAYGVLSARAEQSRTTEEIYRRWPNMPEASSEYFTPVKPTIFGNIFVTASTFTERTFEMDLDFLLPILQVVVAGDSALADGFNKAQQQLNFAIRIFFYVLISVIFWLVVATAFGSSSMLVVAVGAVGLVAAPLALQAVLASARDFVESVKTVSILKRFEILKALHMPLPRDAKAERAAWQTISKQLQWGEKRGVLYDHPTKT